MAAEFDLQILTPARELFNEKVSEVVLPSFDGERGVLAGHEDFVGLLGTGALKLVQNGKDYWFMVSSGLYQVDGGVVSVLAETAALAEEIDYERAGQDATELEPKLLGKDTQDEEFVQVKLEYERAKAKADVYRRTNLVN